MSGKKDEVFARELLRYSDRFPRGRISDLAHRMRSRSDDRLSRERRASARQMVHDIGDAPAFSEGAKVKCFDKPRNCGDI
jgi:hypothetical protein